MTENAQNPAAQNPSSSIQPQNDRSQRKWNMLRAREKDSPMGYTWIGLANYTDKHINIFRQDSNMNDVNIVVIKPHASDIVITSEMGPLGNNLTFYIDDNPYVTNPYPMTFTEDTSNQTFSWQGLPSEFTVSIPNIYGTPNYGDGSAVPPQSGYFPYAVDQFGARWCTLVFSKFLLAVQCHGQ